MKDRMEGPTKLLRRHQPVLKTTDEHGSVLTRKSFAGRKRFFFAKSSRSSRLRGESGAGLSPRRREENAKDFSLVAALTLCEFWWFDFVLLRRRKPLPAAEGFSRFSRY